LLSLQPDPVDIFRRAASYVDHILRGAKPADLPVQLPTKFEMVVNLKTAKSLGHKVSQSILLRADEVIEFAAQNNWTASFRNGSRLCENSARYNRIRNLRLVVTPRAKKRKNSFSTRCYDQIRFRFHTAWVKTCLFSTARMSAFASFGHRASLAI
jgi:hypothetical protein